MKVFIIAAISVDGFIGLNSEHEADWTSKEDKQLFVKLTKESGVMVMGSSTFKTIGRGLPGRKTIVYTSKPESFGEYEGDVEATNESPAELISRLEKVGYKSVAICGGAQIYSLFMESGLVTDLYITVEPVVFGSGIPLFGNAKSHKLSLINQSMLNDQVILLHYEVASKSK